MVMMCFADYGDVSVEVVAPAVKKLCDMEDDDVEVESLEEVWMRGSREE